MRGKHRYAVGLV